jgi:hypothetical protein
MRPLLALSKKEPVNAAIGLTDKDEGLILLDKKAKPRKVLAQLKASAASSKIALNTGTLRFGRAEVDADVDPGLIRFFVNKDAPKALRSKLIEVVKRISYRTVEFSIDPALDAEGEEDEDETETDAPPASPPLPDPAALTTELFGLIGRIQGAAGQNTALHASLKALANEANLALKGNDLLKAAEAMGKLRGALGPRANGQAAAAAPVIGAARGTDAARLASYEKARALWERTLGEVAHELQALTAALKTAYAVENLGEEVVTEFQKLVVPALRRFDDRPGKLIAGAIATPDPAKRAELLGKARGLVATFRADLAATNVISLLDENPLVTVKIAKNLGAALAAMANVLG